LLFTFITDKQGATIAEQLEGADVLDALLQWNGASRARPRFRDEDLTGPDRPTPVTPGRNLWCFSGVDQDDVFFLVHIVATCP
jgi:hypothetical protein